MFPTRPHSASIFAPSLLADCSLSTYNFHFAGQPSSSPISLPQPPITPNMATFYSSFFSSGLLAPLPHEVAASSSPTTPRASHVKLPGGDPFSLHVDTTPTANDVPLALRSANDILPSRPRSDSQGSNRPGLRRRRSSLTVAASPINPIKSNAAPRAARNSYATARARSGSESRSQGNATEGTTVIGRMRSGSVGGHLARLVFRSFTNISHPLM